MDDDNFQNTRYTYSLNSSTMLEMYNTARLAPITLTYFHYCLDNGLYTLKLHFAEIQFTNDNTSSSIGRRKFDIYVQVISLIIWINMCVCVCARERERLLDHALV